MARLCRLLGVVLVASVASQNAASLRRLEEFKNLTFGPGGGLKNSTGPSIMSPAKTRVQPSNAIPLIAMRPGLGLKTTIQLLTVVNGCVLNGGYALALVCARR